MELSISSSLSRYFGPQIEALFWVVENILKPLPTVDYAFGGGTSLALFYYHHRRSFDIDIFFYDSQLFSYLNPALHWEEWEEKIVDYSHLPHYLQLAYSSSNGDSESPVVISLLNTPSLKEHKNRVKIKDFLLPVETPEEIIGKKILYRGRVVGRDLLDIYTALNLDSHLLPKLVDLRIVTVENLKNYYQFLIGFKNEDPHLRQLEREIKFISPFSPYPPPLQIVNFIITSFEGTVNL